MKRHEALAPLSRDHHSTLILAQLLKKTAPVYKGLPIHPENKIVYAKHLFEKDIEKHFEQEEAMLEKVKGCHPELDKLAIEIADEHKQLTKLFASLGSTDDLETPMDELGRALEAHIRKEERVLFPMLQEHCSEDKLEEIHILLH